MPYPPVPGAPIAQHHPVLSPVSPSALPLLTAPCGAVPVPYAQVPATTLPPKQPTTPTKKPASPKKASSPSSQKVAKKKETWVHLVVGNEAYKWFDLEKCRDQLGSEALVQQLRNNVQACFSIPAECQVFFDRHDVLVAPTDFLRAFSRLDPLLYVYDGRHLPVDKKNELAARLANMSNDVHRHQVKMLNWALTPPGAVPGAALGSVPGVAPGVVPGVVPGAVPSPALHSTFLPGSATPLGSSFAPLGSSFTPMGSSFAPGGLPAPAGLVMPHLSHPAQPLVMTPTSATGLSSPVPAHSPSTPRPINSAVAPHEPCRECGETIVSSAPFCRHCGVAREGVNSNSITCPGCGQWLEFKDSFCKHCGTAAAHLGHSPQSYLGMESQPWQEHYDLLGIPRPMSSMPSPTTPRRIGTPRTPQNPSTAPYLGVPATPLPQPAVDQGILHNPPLDHPFTQVTLVRDPNNPSSRLGFSGTPCPDQRDVLISHIAPTGLLAHWNHLHPDRAVQIGDWIVAVNGVTENAQLMMEHFHHQNTVTMLIRKMFHPP